MSKAPLLKRGGELILETSLKCLEVSDWMAVNWNSGPHKARIVDTPVFMQTPAFVGGALRGGTRSRADVFSLPEPDAKSPGHYGYGVVPFVNSQKGNSYPFSLEARLIDGGHRRASLDISTGREASGREGV